MNENNNMNIPAQINNLEYPNVKLLDNGFTEYHIGDRIIRIKITAKRWPEDELSDNMKK